MTPAEAARRVALVIGNSAYEHTQALDNPRNDARLMAKTLKSQGFEVLEHIDVDYKRMKRAINAFTGKLEEYGRDTVGLIFYAGHGLQSRGQNYLVPVDAQIQKEGDIEIETISSRALLSGVRYAGNRLNIVILDACRNNPYRGIFRSASRGLARIDAPVGSLIAFSTAPGTVAEDGKQTNSPYTNALAKIMSKPGLKIEEVFKRVRTAVYSATNGRQVPWESSSIFGDFYFEEAVKKTAEKKPDPKPAPKVQKAKPTPPVAKKPVTTRSDDNISGSQIVQLAFWNSIQSSRNVAMFEEYLRRYPNGIFAFLAETKIAELTPKDKRAINVEAKPVVTEKVEPAVPVAEVKKPEVKKADEVKVASLQEQAVKAEPETPQMSPFELAYALQSELKRVGCGPTTVDGQWGRNSRNAVSQFNVHAKLNLQAYAPTTEALDAVKAKTARVCPAIVVTPKKKKKKKKKASPPKKKKKVAVKPKPKPKPRPRRKREPDADFSQQADWQNLLRKK